MTGCEIIPPATNPLKTQNIYDRMSEVLLSLDCSYFVRYCGFQGEVMESVEAKGNLRQIFGEILERAPYRERQEIGQLPGPAMTRFSAGQVIEVLGQHSESWLVELCKQNPKARLGWLSSEKLDLCPMALAQEGIPLSRFLFLEEIEEKEAFAKVAAFLKSGLFQIIVFEQVFFKVKSEVSLRKLQLLAEEFGVGLVMRSKRATHAFSIHHVVDTDTELVKGGANEGSARR
jgi:hypothetical protein